MIDIELIGLILACSLATTWVMVAVFGWGYRKEQRGERTDIFGRKNNNMPEEDMN